MSDPSSLTLYLLRHGESLENAARLFSARKGDSALSPLGLQQAMQQAQYLRVCELDAIYASPLARARQTAEIVGQCCGIKPVVAKALQEVDVGNLDGESLLDASKIALYDQVLQAWEEGLGDVGFAGGETLRDVHARLSQFLGSLPEKRGQRVLLVGHSLLFAVFIWLFCPEHGTRIEAGRLKRGRLAILTRDTDGYHLIDWNVAPSPHTRPGLQAGH